MDSTAPAGAPDPVVFSGRVIGGENAIQGATITFYETASTGVATSGVYVPATPLTPLGATVTNSSGSFNFATALSCASNSDYVYATSAGGNTGANAVNPNNLLMSAVGSCSSFGSSTYVVINELSTIAAAYALQGFTSVSGTYTTGSAATITGYSITSNVATINATNTLSAGQTVILSGFTTSTFLNGTYIVLSAGLSGTQFEVAINNANVSQIMESGTATPVTVPVVSVTASTTNYATASASTPSAAGLAHAFANAANLKTASSASANTSVPNYSNTIVPAALMNALGNSIQSCVNSTGGTASSSATSGCPALFYYTTINSVVPTNTLSALLNIARNPTNNVQSICSLTPGSGAAFSPAVACGVSNFDDWSMAIVYKTLYGQTSTGSTCASTYSSSTSSNGLCYPVDAALDINDNVYVLNANYSTIQASNVVAISSAGAPLWASTPSTSFAAPEMIAVDGNSSANVFYTNNSQSTSADEYVVQLTASTGAVETNIGSYNYLWGIAIDSSNVLWASQAVASGNQNLLDFTRGSGSSYTYGSLSAHPPDCVSAPSSQIAIDPHKNIWVTNNNSSTAYSPAIYANSHGASEFAVNTTTTFTGNYGIAIDSSGNGWATSNTAFYKMVPNSTSAPTSATVTLAGTYTASGGVASLRYLSIDGNNTIWGADDNGTNSAIVGYPSAASSPTVFTLRPCVAATGTTCSAAGYAVYATHHAVPDSTGSLWVTSDANGILTQIIGAAAPTWPLLSLLKPGTMP